MPSKCHGQVKYYDIRELIHHGVTGSRSPARGGISLRIFYAT